MQSVLFEEPVALPPKRGHTPETIRARMHELLDRVRGAEAMPFTPREAHSHTVMFPYMAEWLPEQEGEQLLLEFREEMARLQKKAA